MLNQVLFGNVQWRSMGVNTPGEHPYPEQWYDLTGSDTDKYSNISYEQYGKHYVGLRLNPNGYTEYRDGIKWRMPDQKTYRLLLGFIQRAFFFNASDKKLFQAGVENLKQLLHITDD